MRAARRRPPLAPAQGFAAAVEAEEGEAAGGELREGAGAFAHLGPRRGGEAAAPGGGYEPPRGAFLPTSPGTGGDLAVSSRCPVALRCGWFCGFRPLPQRLTAQSRQPGRQIHAVLPVREETPRPG